MEGVSSSASCPLLSFRNSAIWWSPFEGADIKNNGVAAHALPLGAMNLGTLATRRLQLVRCC
jgi:hypothetical protein